MPAIQSHPRRPEPPPMSFYPGDAALLRAGVYAKHGYPDAAQLDVDAACVDANVRAGRSNATVDALRALVADSHATARRWEFVTAFHRIDDARATMADLHRTRTATEERGAYEVTIRMDDRDPDLLNVWRRPALHVPEARWTPERIAEYEALFSDGDGLDAIARQDAAERGEAA